MAFSHKAVHTIQSNNEVLVECEKMAADEASSSFEAKTSLCCAMFALVLHDKTPNRWKNQVRCNFFPL